MGLSCIHWVSCFLLLQGSFWGLMAGLVIGMVRFIWEFSYGPAPPCGEDDLRSVLISKVHYLHFGIVLFVIVVIVTIVVSLLTKPIDECHVSITALVRTIFTSVSSGPNGIYLCKLRFKWYLPPYEQSIFLWSPLLILRIASVASDGVLFTEERFFGSCPCLVVTQTKPQFPFQLPSDPFLSGLRPALCSLALTPLHNKASRSAPWLRDQITKQSHPTPILPTDLWPATPTDSLSILGTHRMTWWHYCPYNRFLVGW